MRRLLKELFIFTALFLFLALGMHMNQWIAHPIDHFAHLWTHKMPYHPLLYTFLVYVVLGVFRALFGVIAKLFKRD